MLDAPDDRFLRQFGMHRVIEPRGVLPQAAWKLDNTPVAHSTETLIAVQKLHIDAASFTQIARACRQDTAEMGRHMQQIIEQRGKMHNPVTGSGGVLLGIIEELDEDYGRKYQVARGDTIISLTSLSWLPLWIERMGAVHLGRGEVEVEGKAILFCSNPLAKVPDDLPLGLVVAALDVAGAPARAFNLAQPGMRVTVLGAGGTAGLLTLCALRQRLGANGEIIAIDYQEQALQDVQALGVADVVVRSDATRALDALGHARDACRGGDYEADLTINVVNVPGTEFASILLTRAEGRILFFSMVTSFTAAALGAEGLARQVEMQIGNGYMPDHGAIALQLLRDYAGLRAIFARRLGVVNETV